MVKSLAQVSLRQFVFAGSIQGVGIAMAYKSGTSLVKCLTCETEGKFFKMYQSFRPDHAWTDDEGRTKAVLFCVDCELKNRIKEWESYTEEEKKIAGENYATLDAIRADQKNRSREGWSARSESIKGAKAALKSLKEHRSEEEISVNFMQCTQNMELEDKKEEEEKMRRRMKRIPPRERRMMARWLVLRRKSSEPHYQRLDVMIS